MLKITLAASLACCERCQFPSTMALVRLRDRSVYPVGRRFHPASYSPEQWVAETGEPHDVRGTEDGGQLYQAGEELDGNNPE